MAETSKVFVSYDIRGIQQFIFAVPRLKYIVGASALIDEYDKSTIRKLSDGADIQPIYSGGGRGLFSCANIHVARGLSEKIVNAAHAIGLDIRIGIDTDPVKAGENATDLYSCPVSNLEGEPCSASGLFPVKPGTGQGYREDRRGVHPLVWKRAQAAGRNDKILIDKLSQSVGWPFKKSKPEFLSNVSPDDAETPEEKRTAQLGHASLGARNRWAVVVMDGNDMGAQHRNASLDANQRLQWLTNMSQALDQVTHNAVIEALGKMIAKWADSADSFHAEKQGRVVLPVRPLLIGGDDVILICHAAYAMKLATDIIAAFERLSADRASLWQGTGGKLTISAGVLFCGTKFPLASAIDYAESLLSGAKQHGRKSKKDGHPSPACIDWESLTEGAIDTPAARRQRELLFVDKDIESKPRIALTRRPYTLEQYAQLDTEKALMRKLPGTIRHELLSGLRQPLYARSRFLARLKKKYSELMDRMCWNPNDFVSLLTNKSTVQDPGWQVKNDNGGQEVSTGLLDAALLLEEESRMGNQEESR